MNEDIIKKILKDDSEKLIIIEEGRPKFVVMSYGQYVKLSEKSGPNEKMEMNFEEIFSRHKNGLEKEISGEDKRLWGATNIQRDDFAVLQKKDNDNNLSLEDLPIE